MADDGFERYLSGFLCAFSRTSGIWLIGLAFYGLGYAALFWEMPPARMQISYFVCLALWIASTSAYRLIFGKAAR